VGPQVVGDVASRRSDTSSMKSLSNPHLRVKVILIVLIAVSSMARLYMIQKPLLGLHEWRQYDTAAIARNFHEGSMNILYPQVDWRGSSPGYVESEFQIYTFLVALLYRAFGPHEWLGRGLNVVFFVLSALLLFRLTRRLFDEPAALLAVFFYSFAPLSFFFTRSFQPDALMALCSIAGVYYFWLWVEEDRWVFLAVSVVGVSLAALIKPTNLYLGLPLFYLSYRKFGWRLLQQKVLWLYASLILIPAALWYAHAFEMWKTYGNTFGIFAGNVKVGVWALTDFRWISLAKTLLARLESEIATPVGLLLLIVGSCLRPPKRNFLLHWWAAGFAISILLTPLGHMGHDYYQLPIMFVTAAFMGFATNHLLRQRSLARVGMAALLLLFMAFSALQLEDMLHVSAGHLARITFNEHVHRLAESNAPIVFAHHRNLPFDPSQYQHRTAEGEYLYCDPIDFYLSHHKGWSIDGVQATPEFVETLRRRGAKYFATQEAKHIFEQSPDLKTALERCYTPLEVTPEWVIYRLDDQRSDVTSVVRH
jgi:hypothetical protein